MATSTGVLFPSGRWEPTRVCVCVWGASLHFYISVLVNCDNLASPHCGAEPETATGARTSGLEAKEAVRPSSSLSSRGSPGLLVGCSPRVRPPGSLSKEGAAYRRSPARNATCPSGVAELHATARAQPQRGAGCISPRAASSCGGGGGGGWGVWGRGSRGRLLGCDPRA